MQSQPVFSYDTFSSALPGDVHRLYIGMFVNLYMIGEGDTWALVDTGLATSADTIIAAAEERFGKGSRPQAIILTHGHFDHAGSALELAEYWNMPVYAHELELPFLTGRADYPPHDPTTGGAIGFMSRFFPHSGYNFGERVQALPENHHVPGLPEWRWIHVPGHAPGQIALWRESDRTLIAADALATVNQDSFSDLLAQKKEIYRPAAPFTVDWEAARESVWKLASLSPYTIAAGHGEPISGDNVATALNHFAENFNAPQEGRYAHEPAHTDRKGVIDIPPPVPDPLPGKIMTGLGLGLAAGAAAWALLRTRKNFSRGITENIPQPQVQRKNYTALPEKAVNGSSEL